MRHHEQQTPSTLLYETWTEPDIEQLAGLVYENRHVVDLYPRDPGAGARKRGDAFDKFHVAKYLDSAVDKARH